MIYRYKILSGQQILCEGAMSAESQENALAKCFQKIKRNTPYIKISINDKLIYDGNLYQKGVARKVDNRPQFPWS